MFERFKKQLGVILNSRVLAVALVVIVVASLSLYVWNKRRMEYADLEARTVAKYTEKLPPLSEQSQRLLPLGFSRSFVRGANPNVISGDREQYSSGSFSGEKITLVYTTSDSPQVVFESFENLMKNTAGKITKNELNPDEFTFERSGKKGEVILTQRDKGTSANVILYAKIQ